MATESFATEAGQLAALKTQIIAAIADFTSTNAAKMQYVSECKTSAETADNNRKALQDKIAGR